MYSKWWGTKSTVLIFGQSGYLPTLQSFSYKIPPLCYDSAQHRKTVWGNTKREKYSDSDKLLNVFLHRMRTVDFVSHHQKRFRKEHCIGQCEQEQNLFQCTRGLLNIVSFTVTDWKPVKVNYRKTLETGQHQMWFLVANDLRCYVMRRKLHLNMTAVS